VLYGESEAENIASQLRSIVVSEVAGLNESLNHLSEIGISTSGYDNGLTVSDSELLSDTLINDLDQVKSIFQDETNGIGVKLLAFIDQQIGEDGALPDKVERLNEQSSDIDDQIQRMETFIEARRQRLIDGFVAMETAQQKINQQMSFLSSRLNVPAPSGG